VAGSRVVETSEVDTGSFFSGSTSQTKKKKRFFQQQQKTKH